MAVTLEQLRSRVGVLLKRARLQKGWSRAKLDEMSGVSHHMIGRIERGGSGLRFPLLIKLCNALEIDPLELFWAHLPGPSNDSKLHEIAMKIAPLPPEKREWISGILDAVLIDPEEC